MKPPSTKLPYSKYLKIEKLLKKNNTQLITINQKQQQTINGTRTHTDNANEINRKIYLYFIYFFFFLKLVFVLIKKIENMKQTFLKKQTEKLELNRESTTILKNFG